MIIRQPDAGTSTVAIVAVAFLEGLFVTPNAVLHEVAVAKLSSSIRLRQWDWL
ncbi:hypothetical protein COO91_02059 [Nostoc flagelliforme CCNUN1]|uniref:Uncharacterized protein n=1 Tax=Nostoc flagelliforme CCNUN1 TaxID=2038116 RepID=A0A2K8SL74_9NOSO|nr:hypothetical protein COO91_02059 [Nostoc flagelliforme CCNUN1]